MFAMELATENLPPIIVFSLTSLVRDDELITTECSQRGKWKPEGHLGRIVSEIAYLLMIFTLFCAFRLSEAIFILYKILYIIGVHYEHRRFRSHRAQCGVCGRLRAAEDDFRIHQGRTETPGNGAG